MRALVAVAALWLVTAVPGCAGASRSSIASSTVQQLFSPDSSARDKAEQEILNSRKELTEALVAVIKDEKNRTLAVHRDSVLRAVYILGDMRAVEAIDVLTEYINLDDTPWLTGPRPFDEIVSSDQPCFADHFTNDLGRWRTAEALVKIGEPCIPAVLKRLSDANSEDYSLETCVRVLLELRGREGAAALVRGVLPKEQDAHKRKQLQNALDLIVKAKGPPEKQW